MADTSTGVSSMGSETTTNPGLVNTRGRFVQFILNERYFLIILAVAFFAAGVVYDQPALAAWFGFAIAAYSTVANDSIQTLGAFMASNSKRPWWLLWLFMGGIFLITITYSWIVYGGDVSYGRLASKGFETAPTSFDYLQLAAPIFLVVITRLRMPVSTTFLILSSFSTSGAGVGGMMTKSLAGYGVAFVTAIIIWAVLHKPMQRWFTNKPRKIWVAAQWCTSGFLWSVWLMQDAANIAVYLPRQLSLLEFGGFAGVMFLGLGLLFWLRGDRIQQVVTEKSNVEDSRPAMVIDLVYAVILFVFKEASSIPMSTTWVFLGLLAGRELAMGFMNKGHGRSYKEIFKLVGKDLLFAIIGLIVSLVIAVAVNPVVRAELLGF